MTATAVPTHPRVRALRLVSRVSCLASLLMAGGGCAALSNPVAAEGIPVNRLPEEVLGRPRQELAPLPLTLLRQREPDEYRLDKGDVLGVVAENVIGPSGPGGQGQAYPTQFIQGLNTTRSVVVGYPVPIQDDGTIQLPGVVPINVRGKSLIEAQKLIVAAITGDTKSVPGAKEIVRPGSEKVLVDLIQPRRYQISVVREDSTGGSQVQQGGIGGGVIGSTRRGGGFTITLEAYKNDLLRALNATGGLPGLDAKNEVVIRRGQFDPADPGRGFVRIPLRARPDEPITFTEKDIILNDGDTVYIEARDTEVYYTAGLIGGAQIPLPRDYDLRVVEAIAQVRGPLINGSFNQTAFQASAVNSGIGNPNPSLVTIVRKTANNKIIPIRVNLNLAFNDTRENVLILPGDVLVLQERADEAFLRYVTQTIRFNTNLLPSNNNNSTINQTIATSFP